MSSKKFVPSEVDGASPGVLDPTLFNEIEGWISKIVDPAYRLIAGGATRLLPSIFSSSISHSSTSTLPHTVPPSDVANHVSFAFLVSDEGHKVVKQDTRNDNLQCTTNGLSSLLWSIEQFLYTTNPLIFDNSYFIRISLHLQEVPRSHPSYLQPKDPIDEGMRSTIKLHQSAIDEGMSSKQSDLGRDEFGR